MSLDAGQLLATSFFKNYVLMMVIEYKNNKPTQSSLVSLNLHSISS